MLYQIAYEYLVQAVETELIRRGYRAGLGEALVDLHLDERFYVMPVSVDLAAQQPLLSGVPHQNALVERLADAVEFEDLTNFGGVLRVFARTLLNRAGVSDMVRGQAAHEAASRHHIVPRVGRVLEAMVASPQYEVLTDYDGLLALIESAANDHLNADGPQGFLPEDLSTIQALRAAGVDATQEKVGVVAERCGLQGWVKWTRGLYSGIRCLSSTVRLDLERFRATVRQSIDGGSNGPLALGQVFEHSVQEMGLALSMSFFGDLGYQEFAKPDRHVVNALKAFESVCPKAVHAFERLQWHSLQAGIGPRRLDKVFYLAGSGNFYLTGFDFGPAFKAGFLDHLQVAGGHRRFDSTHRCVAEDSDTVPRQQVQERLPIEVQVGATQELDVRFVALDRTAAVDVPPEEPNGQPARAALNDLLIDEHFDQKVGPTLAAHYPALLQQLATICSTDRAQAVGLRIYYTNKKGRELRVGWAFSRPFEVLLCIGTVSDDRFDSYTRTPADQLPQHLTIQEIENGKFRQYRAGGEDFVANAAALLSAILTWALDHRGE